MDNKDDNIKSFGEVDENDLKKAAAAAPNDLKQNEPLDIGNEILEWVESFTFALFIVILMFTFVFRIVLVDGQSMEDTLSDGDRLIVSHINYTVKRGDIIVLNSNILNKTIIKRCIGIAGDTVKIDYNKNLVTCNGKTVSNSTNKQQMYNTGIFDEKYKISDDVYEYKVPENCVFAMGDNRNNSTDCRSSLVGFVNTKDILGKAVFRLFPFSAFGKIK